MLIVTGLLGVIVVALAVVAVAVRTLDAQVALLRSRVAKLVRLSVAVDDLHHETTQVVPAYRDAMTRARTLRRTEDGEGSR
ncbi:MAG TPA: hypothetical protein VM282_14960 [Acidimicrobiales bacterium]|nr:hypothetical protein [Acidimicrobiales bacterium]